MYYAGIVKEMAHARKVIAYARQAIETFSAEPSAVSNGAGARFAEAFHQAMGDAHGGSTALFRTAKEIADAAESVEWCVRGFLALGAITELTGKAKLAGKTTLIAYIVGCLLDGDLCLGDMARQTPVVYLTEQTPATFREVLRRSHLLHRADLSVLVVLGREGETVARDCGDGIRGGRAHRRQRHRGGHLGAVRRHQGRRPTTPGTPRTHWRPFSKLPIVAKRFSFRAMHGRAAAKSARTAAAPASSPAAWTSCSASSGRKATSVPPYGFSRDSPDTTKLPPG